MLILIDSGEAKEVPRLSPTNGPEPRVQCVENV